MSELDIAQELAKLHTIRGVAFVRQSVDQTNRVLVNVCTTYNPRLMAIQIKNYFDANPFAVEVLVYKGKKAISVTRRFTENPLYMLLFRRKYMQ